MTSVAFWVGGKVRGGRLEGDAETVGADGGDTVFEGRTRTGPMGGGAANAIGENADPTTKQWRDTIILFKLPRSSPHPVSDLNVEILRGSYVETRTWGHQIAICQNLSKSRAE